MSPSRHRDDEEELPGGNGSLIGLVRLLYGLTLAQVGERVGRSPSWVWKVEEGHLRVDVFEAVHVAVVTAEMGEAGEGKRGPFGIGAHRR